MKVFWIVAGVLWVCVAAASVDLLVFGHAAAVNGVIGAGLTAVLCTGLAVFSRGLDAP